MIYNSNFQDSGSRGDRVTTMNKACNIVTFQSKQLVVRDNTREQVGWMELYGLNLQGKAAMIKYKLK